VSKIGVGSVLAAFVAASCFAQNPHYQPDPEWRPPTQAQTRENPLAARPELAAGGRKLFVRNCAECHGRDGAGLEKKHSADLQLPVVQQESDGALFWKISNGNAKRGMPSFSKIPELQRWQIVLYVRTLKARGESGSRAKSRQPTPAFQSAAARTSCFLISTPIRIP
jgi:mono/diheme cytochrome c family protein